MWPALSVPLLPAPVEASGALSALAVDWPPRSSVEFRAAESFELLLEPLKRDGDRVYVEGFKPCLVLLHNDLSGGRPDILEGLKQPVVPHPKLGWSDRLKTQHFALYKEVAEEFAERFGIDPWLLNPLFRNCGEINFAKREGEECLASNVELILEDIKAKYAEYGVTDEPFVIIKADAGTYGMGIMTVKDPSEVKGLNRKQRNKMAVVKEGLEVNDVIVQEGVYTFENVGDAIAEPVVYMIDHFVVGGFYRVHTERGKDQNLNAPGMQFVPLAFDEPCSSPNPGDPGCPPNRFYSYGVIARLALLAAAIELERMETPETAPAP